MLALTPQRRQLSLTLGNDLISQLNPKNPYLLLARVIPWNTFEDAFRRLYSDMGRPSMPIRAMVGLLMIKQLENLSDERVVTMVEQNPYFQAFCGYCEFLVKPPCDPSDLTRFRQRIGKEGAELIFQESAKLHGKKANEEDVNVDTTVQEKAVSYPTDGRLAIKIINRLNKLAKSITPKEIKVGKRGCKKRIVKQRRTYIKEVKCLRHKLRQGARAGYGKKSAKAVSRLRTIAGALMRELERRLPADLKERCERDFTVFRKVISQKKSDKDKIYSLHELHVYCMAKGKAHKKFEFGTKASIAATAKSGIIVAVKSHPKNIHDSKTLEDVLEDATKVRTKPVKRAVCDRGYRGAGKRIGEMRKIGETEIALPNRSKSKDSRYRKDRERKRFRRRAAIEPLIGHLKADFRLGRNFLKGMLGDEINLFMAACAWNLRKLVVAFFLSLFFSVSFALNWMFFQILRKKCS